MVPDVIETPVEQAPSTVGDRVGPILRVGIPTTGGKILRAAKEAGYSVLFSTNAFMVRNQEGEVVSVRRPDPVQFAGLDAALDSAGFVAMARYRGFPWSVSQYLDLVASWPWAWYASWDQCVEPEIASSKIDVYFRLAETCRLLSEVRSQARDRGLPDPMPVVQGWEVDHYRWSLDHLPLSSWPKLLGVGSMCRRRVHGPNGILTIVEALDRTLPPGVGLHLFGVKGEALRYLSDHPRIASVDSMAWDFAARRQVPVGRTSEMRIDVMHQWVRRNASQLELPKAPYDLQLFEEPSEEASQELQEWLELVVDNQTDAVSAWHHCMRTWVGG